MKRRMIRLLGRGRLRALGGWLLLTGAALLAAALLRFGLEPLLPAAAAGALGLIRGHALAQALLLLLLAYVAWRRCIDRPLRRHRARMRAHAQQRKNAVRVRMHTLTAESDKRGGQLNAILQVNRGFRDKLSRLASDQQRALRARDAALNMTQDALLLTDVAGVVVAASPAAATLLRAPRESLIGRRFDDVAPLFQSGSDHFRDFPLRDFLTRIIASGSSIPQIKEAVLLNQENEPVSVFVTAAPILDPAAQASGCSVRLGHADSPQAEQTARPQLSLAEAEMNDWGSKLLSREPFERRLDELIAAAKASGAHHSLLVIRVDDLDQINDQHGYWAGEQALWHAAKNLALALADIGTGYRYANSRFAVLLLGHDEARALQVAERIRAHAQANELIWNDKRIACTFSIAVLPVDRETRDRNELLGAAESLLIDAKHRGGNRVLAHVPDEAAASRRRDDQTWLDWLLPRLDDGRAHLISQELQSLATPPQQPLVEFFIRVEDDDGVWLEPGYYLPAVERLRQSQRVDLWTLKSLLAALDRNPQLLDTHAVASLNLAPQSLLDTAFAPAAFELLAGATVPPERLCFEIDESFAVSQPSVVQRFMEQLRPTGVRFALDRCHTTMGITQLRHLPVDYMKIHPSVTRNIESDSLDRTHLEWICRAAHLLQRKTAAINIESPATIDLLRRASVDYVQGTAVNRMGPMMT